MQHSFDVVIIGGGIAGASLAYQLCREHRVLLLERETQAGYHATGRSAALFSTTYGNDTIQTLSRMSEAFFRCPPPGFCAAPLLQPRGALLIARHEQRDSLAARLGTPGTQWLEGAALQELVPVLRADTIAAGLYEPQASDVDVASLHEGFLRALRTRPDCRLCLESGVVALESRADGWHVRTERASYVAPLLVNAAGAWADELAALAGLRPGGLLPKKRTAAIVATNEPVPASQPMVIDVAESFYFKPDSGRVLLSPGDESDTPPGDVWADDLDVAVAVERLEAATTLRVQRVVRAWAGLRTFSADRSPVVGFEPGRHDFFWFAGQGGYGIQTAPALARIAAYLLDPRLGEAPDAAMRAALAPQRLGR